MSEQNKEYVIISILPIMMLIFSFMISTPKEIFYGMVKIITTNDILTTDYFIISNIGATFFNVSITTLFVIHIMYLLNLRLNGLLVTSIFLVISFSFMGKNLFNILPFYIGTAIYSMVMKKTLKSVVAIGIMSTSLAPLANIFFPFGFFVAVAVAFVLPNISKNVLTIHEGYNLYNAGYTSGIVGIVIYSVLLSIGVKFDKNLEFSQIFDVRVFVFFLLYFIILIIISILYDKNILRNFFNIQRQTGRLVTDFVSKEGFYAALLNMSLLGITCLLFAYKFMLLNGPIICGILTVVGFGGFGKNIKNVTPIFLGILIARCIFKVHVDDTTFLMIFCFSTALAPIAGKYGLIAGMVSGILHYAVVTNISYIHGGLNLYNNGLAAGLVATVMVPIMNMMWEDKN